MGYSASPVDVEDGAKVIRDLVTNFLSPSTKSENDLREAVRLVSDLDVPPFGDLAALASGE